MDSGEPLCDSVREKIEEQIERMAHMISLLPAESGVEKLLGHLLDCLAGFCAVLAAGDPVRLAHFAELRKLPVNQACPPAEALRCIEVYRAHIEEGFAGLRDADLSRRIATVFVPEGETLLTLLLGNLEHLINHKHELFVRLKQMGVRVGSADLYRFRGGASSA